MHILIGVRGDVHAYSISLRNVHGVSTDCTDVCIPYIDTYIYIYIYIFFLFIDVVISSVHLHASVFRS